MPSTHLVFGWRSAILSLAILQLLILAGGLSQGLANRAANRSLSALLVVIAGLLTPFAIGFAGFYDRWPWLSFAPFAVPLAIGPLVWFYVHGLVTGVLPRRAGLHLAPPAVQFVYLCGSFLLPLAAKSRWDRIATPLVDPLVAAGVIAGLVGYFLASLRLLRAYRRFLAQQRSDDHRYAVTWLDRAVATVLVLLAVRAAYQLADWVRPLDYFGMLGLYLLLAAVGLYLGVEGWRHAGLAFPPLTSPDPAAAPAGRDWTAQGRAWALRTQEASWHLDPELSLTSLARRLATNPSYLSRALNEGLGLNFSTFVNRLRAQEVARLIDEGDRRDLLTLALACGFSSKASFNRAFRAAQGCSPSDYRRGAASQNP